MFVVDFIRPLKDKEDWARYRDTYADASRNVIKLSVLWTMNYWNYVASTASFI